MNAVKQTEARQLIIRYIIEVSNMIQLNDTIPMQVPAIFPKSYGEKIIRVIYEIATGTIDTSRTEFNRMLWMHHRHFCELYALVYIEADATDEN
jgi:hypothetical protein